METKIGKLLVLANVFVSVGLLAWAVSIYTNRPAYFDSKDGDTAVTGQFTQYANEIKRLSDGVQLAQSGYVGAMDRLAIMEQDRAYRNSILDILIDEVRKPGNPAAVFRVMPRHPNPELRGLVEVGKWNAMNPFPPALDLRNQPLKGFGRLQQEMRDLLKDERDNLAKSKKFRDDANAISLELNDLDPKKQVGLQWEVLKMKVIFQNLDEEDLFLADAQVNWEEQLRTLKLRKQQLADRLAEFAKPAPTGNTTGGQ
ncbi:hypothetical protein [Limnoglobus roseus]|uniref:Uncharacterized protein n=1 Tax=Limnoglobus roseus TaxID=2598579 RepID=A0A5C1A7M5_9BACT|nr:hypothetical protein [Limnoglobus roseus]QEL14223.1 hypothetical protein PX52LOC_01093 [Limnoglobus roseus]